jgi:transposase
MENFKYITKKKIILKLRYHGWSKNIIDEIKNFEKIYLTTILTYTEAFLNKDHKVLNSSFLDLIKEVRILDYHLANLGFNVFHVRTSSLSPHKILSKILESFEYLKLFLSFREVIQLINSKKEKSIKLQVRKKFQKVSNQLIVEKLESIEHDFQKEEDEKNQAPKLIPKQKIADSLKKYQAILDHFKLNLSPNDIAENIGTSYQNVKNWIKKFLKYGDINFKLKGGRKPIDNSIQEKIFNFINCEDGLDIVKKVLVHMKEEKIKISKRSVYNILKKFGRFRFPKNVPLISEKCKRERLDYCQEMIWRSSKNIIYSDETTIEFKRRRVKIFNMELRLKERHFQQNTTSWYLGVYLSWEKYISRY